MVAWLKKVRLVAKLQNIADSPNLIHLYPEGDALDLYLEMNEREQTDMKRIEDRSREAFMDGVFVSYKLSMLGWTDSRYLCK